MRKRIAECEMRIAELEMGNAKLGRFRIPDSTIFGASQSFPLRNPQSAFLSPQFRNPQSAIRNTSKPWTALALAHNGANLLLGWREDHATSGSGPGSSNLLSSMPRSSIGE